MWNPFKAFRPKLEPKPTISPDMIFSYKSDRGNPFIEFRQYVFIHEVKGDHVRYGFIYWDTIDGVSKMYKHFPAYTNSIEGFLSICEPFTGELEL